MSSGLRVRVQSQTSKKGSGYFSLSFFCKAAVALIMIIGVIGHFFTSFTGLPLEMNGYLLAGGVLTLGVCLLLNAPKWMSAVFWAALALMIIYIWVKWPVLEQGFRIIADAIYIQIMGTRDGIFGSMVIEEALVEESARALMNLVVVFLSFFIGFSLIGRTSLLLLLLVTFPIAELSLYNGIEPAHWAAALELAGWMGTLAMTLAEGHIQRGLLKGRWRLKRRKKAHRELMGAMEEERPKGGEIGGVMALLTLGVFFGSTVLMTSLGIGRSMEVNALRDSLASNISIFNGNVSRYWGGLPTQPTARRGSEVELRNSNPGGFLNVPVLKVKTQMPEAPIFLKGYVGSEYENGSWNVFSAEVYSAYPELFGLEGGFHTRGISPQSLTFKLYELAFLNNQEGIFYSPRQRMEIRSLMKGYAPFYAPYGSEYPYDPGLLELQWDGGAVYLGEEPRTVDYVPTLSIDETLVLRDILPYPRSAALEYNHDAEQAPQLEEQLAAYTALEALYSNFTAKEYLQLPGGDIPRLVEKWSQMRGAPLDVVVNTVMNALSTEDFTYTLQPGATPDNVDFAEYFLFDSKEGYCTYFASAATLMFRAAGIPARYVEGYVLVPEDFTESRISSRVPSGDNIYEVPIEDTRSHAWTEIYCGWLGWQPIDVTPGNGSPAAPENRAQVRARAEAQKTAAVTTTAPKNLSGTGTTSSSVKAPAAGEAKKSSEESTEWSMWIIAAGAILLAVGIFFTMTEGRYYYEDHRRRRVFRSKNRVLAAKGIHGYYMALTTGILGAPKAPEPGRYKDYAHRINQMFPEVADKELIVWLEMMEQITFNGYEPRGEELELGKKICETIKRERLERATKYGRLYLRWIRRL